MSDDKDIRPFLPPVGRRLTLPGPASFPPFIDGACSIAAGGDPAEEVVGSLTPAEPVEGKLRYGCSVEVTEEYARGLGWAPGKTMTFELTDEGRTYRFVDVTGRLSDGYVAFTMETTERKNEP